MIHPAGFICLFFVAFAPDICQGQAAVMRQVYRLLDDIDRMVQEANASASVYATEVTALFDNLNATASEDLASVYSAVNDSITSFESKIADVVSDVDNDNVSECEDLATSVISTAIEILKNVTSCISGEVDQAKTEVELILPYVDFQLKTLGLLQTSAEYCVSRFDESEQESSDAMEAFACVQPLHRSAQLFEFRFKLITDIELAKDLFSGYENRVAQCKKFYSKKIDYLNSNAQEVYEEISTCVAQSTASSS